MPFEGVQAAVADVEYRTNLGVFRAEQEQVQAVYARTTGAMQDEALKLAVAQERLNRSIAQQGPESYAAAKATVAYRATVDELARSETAAAAAAERAARQRLAAYAGAARTVGSTLTRSVALPTALLTAAAVKMGVDFQQQMLLIQTQAGASAGEVHKLTGEVLQLAKFAPQGPAELAKGLYHLESLGLRDAKAMDTLRISALAAGMGIADLESTATALGAVVVTGIHGAENYDRAMGTLVGTVGAGNVRMEDLAGAIGNVAPAAAAAGVDLTSLGAAIATLTDRGFSADEATTRLRISLALIQSPSNKARKALADMGIDADQLGATLREPNGLLKVLETLHAGIERVGKTRGNRDLLAGFGGGRSGLGIQTLVQSLDSTVSSYRQKLDQVDAQTKAFVEHQKAYLHSVPYQLHHDLASIESDLTSAGVKIAPVFVEIVDGVRELVDVFGHLPAGIKTDLGVLVGVLAVGGPLLLGVSAGIRGVESLGRAWGYMSGSATKAVTATDEQLALLRAQAAETAAALEAAGAEGGAGLAAGIGAGVAKSEAELAALRAGGVALGTAGAAEGGAGLLGGIRGGIGRAGAYGIGGLVAGQVIEGVVPGQAGQTLGRAAEYAGLGAALGSFVGPEGTAAGAVLGGFVGSVTTLIHEGPSATQELDAMGQSLNRFSEAAAASGHAIVQLRQQIANDRVGRDQAQQEVQAARAEEKATRGTRQHAAAVDRLSAAQANLGAAEQQLAQHTRDLTRQEAAHTAELRRQRPEVHGVADQIVTLGQHLKNADATIGHTTSLLGVPVWHSTSTNLHAAADAGRDFANQMRQMAANTQATNPKLAEAERELAAIALRIHHIPDKKTMLLVIKTVYEDAARNGHAPTGSAAFDAARAEHLAQVGGPHRNGHHRYVAPFTVTIPVGLQINVQRAQNAGDVASQRRYLQEELAFLQAELRKAQAAHDKQEELQALQAIGAVDSQLASLQSTSTRSGKTRQQRYLDHVRAEQGKLEINLARARLAERRAGENKTLLDRAHRAERRALQDEINFYRREAHDQELALRERQRYAKLQVAAEAAKLKIGKQAKQQTQALALAEAQVLSDIQTILQNYAPNVWSTSTKPDVHVHQHFPSGPTDHHRQARNAVIAMRAAFDS